MSRRSDGIYPRFLFLFLSLFYAAENPLIELGRMIRREVETHVTTCLCFIVVGNNCGGKMLFPGPACLRLTTRSPFLVDALWRGYSGCMRRDQGGQ